MSLLPTAHAGQSFGARRIDFYTVSGEVSASDDGTGRVTDTDGMSHDVRLLERSNALAPGDTASVLRVQAGPNRRSRPTAIVNHTRGTWMRAAPDATGLLARSGVTRGFNWWLSVLALALVGIAAVWPAIHGFLTEVNGGLMASVPAFDVFAEMQALLPGLSGWRLEAALPTGLLDTIASLGFVPMAQLTEWGLALAGGLVALLAFAGRSWRLIYIPALALLALATGTILGSALATLAVIGGSLGLFMLGGLVNRIRDGGRFNARVARLAEHALRNPPHEGVRPSGGNDAAGVTASAAIAAATTAAHGDEADVAEADSETAEITEIGETGETDTDAPDTRSANDSTAAPAEDDAAANASGEAEAPAQDDLLPAAPVAANDDAMDSDSAEAAIPEDAGETEAAADAASAEIESPEAADEPTPAIVETDVSDTVAASEAVETSETVATSEAVETSGTVEAVETSEAVEASETVAASGTVAASEAGETSETVETSENNAITGSPADTPDTPEETAIVAAVDNEVGGDPEDDADVSTEVELDDDLPSLDDVAAAAALTAAETTPSEAASEADESAPLAAADLDDERTMPVAPPPPMPGNDEAEAARTDAADESISDDEAAGLSPSGSEEADTVTPPPSAAASDDSATIVDDPLMDLAEDPMMTSEGRNDYAPGAPEIDLDRTPAE
ncbi:hypothetical protein [Maricaulis maris]|uniref:Uncharacterized protein n=1 Tax=Maricaulis maris TaxID=74318 RepID=A0A495D463_9PROT|nr:hypothetical protein [Maricaulis maris]RKQ96011.1 hypothetical protein C7435_2260 [Maricaulis maris]